MENCIWNLYQKNWPIDLATRECHATFPSATPPMNGTTASSISPVSPVSPSVGMTSISSTSPVSPLTNATSIVIGEMISDCVWILYQRNWPIDLAERECILNFPAKHINGTTLLLPDSTVSSNIGPTSLFTSDEAVTSNVWIW